MMHVHTVNPATGERLADYRLLGHSKVEEILAAAHQAWLSWRRTDLGTRSELLRATAAALRSRASEHAELMAREMGKPVAQGRAEAEKCARVCDFYAEHGPAFLASEPVETEARRSHVAHRPLGLLLAVMPWNFPYWQVFRFAAPALMAGNGVLLKHALNVTGCGLRIEQVFREAGFPEDLFRTVLTNHEEVGRIIDDKRVRGVTLTGSVAAGAAVAQRAAARIKPTVLELGGSDPYLILEDADLDRAVSLCARSRLINGGQSCIAAKRLIVVEKVADAFVEGLLEELRSRRMGDPLDEGTDLGPQARRDLRDTLHAQVLRSVGAGAELSLGGEVPDGPGAWYPPTLLDKVTPGMPAFDEETFGPVAAVVRVADEGQAVELANASSFGLGAAVFTQDEDRGRRIAEEELEAGCCFVNDFVRSDPRLPFGGVKDSGYGRELSHHGLRAWTNTKTIYVA